tara:strand:+ start:128 stop:982 length:855 start_codon:yes stop_codon:yes gene_type:complete
MRYLNNLLLLSFFFFACSDNNEEPEFSEMPLSFTKKVLIEEFTATWCGYCPWGASIVENIVNDNDNVIPVAVHVRDGMSIDHSVFLETTYQSSSYPAGMVDRAPYNVNDTTQVVSFNAGYFTYFSANQLLLEAECGLAMRSKVSGDIATIEVRAGFNTDLDGDYRLTVYLIEDGVTGSGYGFDQINWDNEEPQSDFYGMGDPIVGYVHNHTLRAVLSGELGDTLDESVLTSGGEHIASYSISISNYDKKKLSAVAFIQRIGADFTQHEILNVQKVGITGFQDWD